MFEFLQDVLQFLVLFARLLMDILAVLLRLLLPKNLKDISNEIVLVTKISYVTHEHI